MKLKQPDIKGFTHSSGSMEKSKPTPMIKQYLEVKNRHKDYLLFYRMGDFYELFFNDAKVASSQLGIALTKRGKLNDEDIPMCGVPAHSSQTYLSRLINLGHKVAIAEQLEDEDQNDVKKNQKIFKRDVVRIITPGTILDDSLLESKSYNHLLSISSFKGDIAISWTDMTTGTIKLQRIKGKNLIDDLFECTNRIEPGEIIVSDSFEKLKILDSRFNQFESKITRIPSSFFDEENNKKKIKEFFNNSQIESFGDLKTIDISALGAVLNYLELTQKKNIPLIKNIEIVQKQDFMQIDNFSVKSLELFEKIDGEKKGSLLSIIDKTKTASGGRLLKDFLKSPLIKTKDIKARHNLIEAFLKDSISMKKIIDLLSGQPDVERALSRISAKTNNPRDLLIVSNFLENSEKIFLGIRECNESIIKNLLPDKNFQENAKTLKFLINKNIKAPPPINLNDGDVIKEGVNVKLDYLRNIKNDKQNEILQMQARYSKLTSVLNLKIKFNNIHGYFIEVTNKNSNKIINFPGLKFNLIQNTINNARFQTEELRDASNEIQNAQMNSIDLEKKIYDELCGSIEKMSKSVDEISKKIAFIDVILNFANLAYERNYTKPHLVEKTLIDIRDCRHPVVEESLRKESLEFTPNDCLLNTENMAWLMTGPNMAGKSTFLRQIAIIVILNQIGSFVPAESVKLSIFDKIFTRIGASDNLSRGMSTFMMEMVETSRIINEATKDSLVILDELGRGTSTEDGLAIAQAVLEYILKEIKCITLFATHYKQLCFLSDEFSQLKSKTMEIKKWKEEIIFLYKVVDGVSEGSFGIHVANMAGIKKPLINRSKEILKNLLKNEPKTKSIPDNSDFISETEDDKNLQGIQNLLDRINLDELSPKESLDILYTIKKNYLI